MSLTWVTILAEVRSQPQYRLAGLFSTSGCRPVGVCYRLVWVDKDVLCSGSSIMTQRHRRRHNKLTAWTANVQNSSAAGTSLA